MGLGCEDSPLIAALEALRHPKSTARMRNLGLWKTLSIGGGYAKGVKAKETKGE